MKFNFLKKNNMERVIPTNNTNNITPIFTIEYSEDDIRRICKEHINNKFNLNIEENDFFINLSFETDVDGYEMKDFYCEIDEQLLRDEDIERLESGGYLSDDTCFHSLLRTVMFEEFNNPEYVLVDAFLGVDREILVNISMPLSHYDNLNNSRAKAIAKVFIQNNDLIVLGNIEKVQNFLDNLYQSKCNLGSVEINKEEFCHKCEYCEHLIVHGEKEECPVLVTSHEVNLSEEECEDILNDYKKDMPWAEVVNLC